MQLRLWLRDGLQKGAQRLLMVTESESFAMGFCTLLHDILYTSCTCTRKAGHWLVTLYDQWISSSKDDPMKRFAK